MMVSEAGLEIATALRSAQTMNEARQLAAREFESLGFEHFQVGLRFARSEKPAILDGYPTDWTEHYDQQQYVNIDPIVAHCVRHTELLDWSQIRWSKGSAGVKERRLMKEASEAGLKTGFSIPLHGPGSEFGVVSVATSYKQADTTAPLGIELDFAAQSVHQCLRRLVLGEQSQDKSNLTQREKECLRWTANGKTAWEIAKILSISESTVCFHMKNTIQKMHVNNRSQAVARALSESIITLH